MKAAKRPPMCGSCKRSEIHNEPATYAVEGYRINQITDRKHAFRANVCDAHFWALVCDPVVIRSERKINPGAAK